MARLVVFFLRNSIFGDFAPGLLPGQNGKKRCVFELLASQLPGCSRVAPARFVAKSMAGDNSDNVEESCPDAGLDVAFQLL